MRRYALVATLGAAGSLVAGTALAAGAAPASAGVTHASAVAGKGSNGIAALPPAAALAVAAAALKREANLVIAGRVAVGGGTIHLVVESADKGSASEGTLVANKNTAGFTGTLKFVTLPSADYLWGGRRFWRHELAGEASITPAERAKLVAALTNTWIKLPPSDAAAFTSGLGVLVQPAKLATELTTTTGTLTKGKVAQVGTVRALPITSSNGGRVWLATTGKPLPILVTGTSTSSEKGQVRLSYPAKLSVSAPAGAKTLGQLGIEA